MADDIERDPVTTDTPVPPPRHRKRWLWRILAVLVLGPLIVIGLWVAIAMNYTFSTGRRAGYVQKFSKKGWLCKTWEGEIAMANMPGTMPEVFDFTVRDDSIAHVIERDMGKRVALTYDQHRGIPTSCFGETQYFVTGAEVVEDNQQFAPQAPGAPPPPSSNAPQPPATGPR